jgi:glutamate-1-semialdehyde aminotransferase
LEVQVAERIIRFVPGVEMVRFAKSGSDATSAAVRAARAMTGRDHVLFSGYHGWQDWHIGATSRGAGVPTAVRSLTHGFAFNDLASLDSALEEAGAPVAAIILEPAGAREPESGFLEAVRERADARGALLIFDEILTGFRLAKGGAQERYGVRADFVCFAKALANGMPLSAVAGAARHMTVFEDDVFFSGTHGGEVLSLAAARATLDVLQDDAVHPHLWSLGADLMDRIKAAADAHGISDQLHVQGAAPMSNVVVDEPADSGDERPAFSLLQQELAKRGVLFNGSNFICVEHSSSHIEEIAAAYDEAIAVLARCWPDGLDQALEGPPVRRVFRPVLGSRAAAQQLA